MIKFGTVKHMGTGVSGVSHDEGGDVTSLPKFCESHTYTYTRDQTQAQ